jgi:hypothetical protein
LSGLVLDNVKDWRGLALYLHAKLCAVCLTKYTHCDVCLQNLKIKELTQKDTEKGKK